MDKSYFLEIEDVFAHYDEIKHIAFIVYAGRLTAEMTLQVYQWMSQCLEGDDSPTKINGCIFDFQKVTDIEARSVLITQRASEELNQQFDLSSIPVALIAAPNPTRDIIEQMLTDSPQPERKRLVSSMEEAIEFLNQFRQLAPPSPNILDTPQVTCHFDPVERSSYIAYYDVLTADVTASVYAWMTRAFDHYGGGQAIENSIIDFRKVSRFDPTNTRKVTQTSGQLNTNYDMSHIAVALIVRDASQEQLVRLMMHLTPQEKRKKIVRSINDAWEFINSFKQEKI